MLLLGRYLIFYFQAVKYFKSCGFLGFKGCQFFLGGGFFINRVEEEGRCFEFLWDGSGAGRAAGRAGGKLFQYAGAALKGSFIICR